MAAYKQQDSREVPVAQYLLRHASVHLTFLPLTVATDGVSDVSDQASKSWSFHWDIFRLVCHDVLCSCSSPFPLLVHPSPLIIADQFPPALLYCHAACMALQVKSLAPKPGALSSVPMTHIVLVENRLLQFVLWLPYLPHGTHMQSSPK